MSNVFEEIGHGLKVAAVDTEHVIVDVATYLPRVAKAIDDAIVAEPELKAVVTGLIGKFTALGPDVLAAVASKGLDLANDLATVTAVEGIVSYFTGTFLPVAEKLVGEVVADVK